MRVCVCFLCACVYEVISLSIIISEDSLLCVRVCFPKTERRAKKNEIFIAGSGFSCCFSLLSQLSRKKKETFDGLFGGFKKYTKESQTHLLLSPPSCFASARARVFSPSLSS